MNRILSRYSPKFPKTLVYMLQESEYSVREYVAWLRRTRNYGQVAVRKQLKMTPKATLLLVAAWLVSVLVYLTIAADVTLLTWTYALYAGWANAWPIAAAILLAELYCAPFFIAFLLVAPLAVGELVIQKPREYRILRRAHETLAKAQATKIVIAGSFGKTTFKDTLQTVLAKNKKVAATPGNYNTPLGIARFTDQLKSDEEVLIIEAGEYYPGDIQQICKLVEPNWGVITGVNEAHMMRFRTLDRTVGTIFELADYLGQKPLWVNEESEPAARQERGRRYSRDGVGDWRVGEAKTGLDGTSFTATKGNVEIKANTKLLGLHQIGSLVAVIDIATELGLTPKQIEAGIARTAPFEHRFQSREDGGVVTIDDTYNGNPDGFRAGIEFLHGLKGHRRIYVTPGIVELADQSAAIHRQVGQWLARSGIEMIILVKNSATPHIAQGLEDGNYKGEVKWFDDGPSAYKALPNLTVKGDVVLLQNDCGDSYA